MTYQDHLAALHAPSAKTRWQAAAQVYYQVQPDTQTIEHLLQALDDPHTGVQTYAVKSLRKILDAALPHLLERINTNPAPHQLSLLIDIIAASPSSAARDALHQVRLSPDAEVRIAAVQAMSRRADEAHRQFLLDALKDSHKQVRYHGALGAARYSYDHAPQVLVEHLHDHEVMVRGAVMYALGKIRDPQTIPALVEAFRAAINDANVPAGLTAVAGKPMTEDQWRRFAASHGQADLPLLAIQAIARMGEDARPTLTALVDDPDPKIQHCARWALSLL